MNNALRYAAPLGRLLLVVLFIMSGWSKISGYEGTQGYMESMGVPGGLLPLVIALEILGGIAVLVGFKARWIALILAIFTIASAVIFHADFADQNQMMHFMKNLAIAGGFLMIAGHGPGALSVDKDKYNYPEDYDRRPTRTL